MVNNKVAYCIYDTFTVCLQNNLENNGDNKEFIKIN